MSVSLATIDQLAAFMQQDIANNDPSALLLLDVASGMVRDYLQQELTYSEDTVEVLDPINGYNVILPEFPIVSIYSVETTKDNGNTWTTMDPSTYTLSRRTGVIKAKTGNGITWPSDPESWRVTYTHGFEEIPESLVGVVLGVAARFYVSPGAVEMERIGNYQVKYTVQADGFSPLEKVVLDRYKNGRVA